MSTTSFVWLSILFLPFCLHSVCSEKLEFLKLPQSREIVTVGANLTINCTTNNETAQTAVYYRRRIKSVRWKKIEAIPGQVIHEGSVYTLVAITRNNKGQYQCRASESTNSTETKWPDNVGIIIVRGGLDKGSRKPDSKVQENKKPGHKRPRQKKTGSKKPKRKRLGPKKPRQKKPDNKKADKKRISRKKPGHKRPGSRKPGVKRPGHKRGGTKRPGRKQTGTRRPGKKRPGLKKPSKQGPKLKVLNNTVTVIEGSIAVMKCSAQMQGDDQPIISWYRSKKLIGCSDKKDLRCSSGPSASRRYLITYKVRTTKGGNRKKLTSYLRIPKTRRARDQDIYRCKARDKQGSTRQAIRLKIKKKRSS